MNAAKDTTELNFDSRKCPGSVVVRNGRVPLGMIVVCADDVPGKIKKGDRFFIPITQSSLSDELKNITPGTYQEVKEKVIDVFKKHTFDGSS